jgi:hypothetical protein
MQEPFDRKFLEGATEQYALGHLDIFSCSLQGRLHIHHNS